MNIDADVSDGAASLDAEPLRACSEILGDFEAALAALKDAPTEIELQRQVCLASRSSYTDFYSESVLSESIDEGLKKQLENCLRTALALLPPDEKYWASVQARFNDFVEFCARPVDTSPQTTASPDFNSNLAG